MNAMPKINQLPPTLFSAKARVVYRSLLSALLSILLMPATVWAAESSGDASSQVYVELGTHQLIRESSAIGRIAVGDPKVAGVNLINTHEILVTGKSAGVTNLLVWSRREARKTMGVPKNYRVMVGLGDAQQQAISGMQIRPGQSISGSADNLFRHHQAVAAATPSSKGAASDLSSVALNSEVLTKIQIVEVQRSVINKFGLNVLKSTGTPAVLGAPGSFSGIQGSGGATTFLSGSGFVPLQNAFGLLLGSNGGGIFGLLSVLESNGLARILAEPSLMAMSGQTATFLAGGEIPVPVAQSSGTGNQSITIEYKKFGIRVSLTPTVLSRNAISLKVAPEVSDLDFSNAVSIGGTTVPALTVRRTETTVQLGDGESFVISGLISNNLTDNVNKVPWLGDIPVIGAFFRSTEYQRKQKELIMVVTPHLVRPIAAGAQLPKLPGADTDSYHPSFADTMFFDTGHAAGDDTGYSR